MCSCPYSTKSLPVSLGGMAVLSNTCIAVSIGAASLNRLLMFLIKALAYFSNRLSRYSMSLLEYLMSVMAKDPPSAKSFCETVRLRKQWRSEDALKCRPPNITNLDDLMEEGFNLLLRKRRTNQLSCDSSLDTSPESKKLKEGDISYSSEGERNEEGDDIILSALNMAVDLQKPLQDILKKLEKLEVIEEAVNNLGKSFDKLEGRIHTLEDSYVTTKRDVEDLKESLNANEIDKKTTAERIQKLEDDTIEPSRPTERER